MYLMFNLCILRELGNHQCAIECLQCRESASKAPHQSASEGIYWFCREVEKKMISTSNVGHVIFNNHNGIKKHHE